MKSEKNLTTGDHHEIRVIVREVVREELKKELKIELETQRQLYEANTERYLGTLMENLADEKKALFEHFTGYTQKIDDHENRLTKLEHASA